ncbi:hypothetical protein [Conchiformibius kuhniae]|uniref:Uncharacterized protein n=1 Tax=Conchiformibius kuhniae TaxID=211502 RepID=A0ABD8B865_9NEIS|nr:hypothetical protein [Conchiformibius kuhniae]
MRLQTAAKLLPYRHHTIGRTHAPHRHGKRAPPDVPADTGVV